MKRFTHTMNVIAGRYDLSSSDIGALAVAFLDKLSPRVRVEFEAFAREAAPAILGRDIWADHQAQVELANEVIDEIITDDDHEH